jgi:hypothetical protein
MGDERVEARTILGRIYADDRFGVGGIGAEAVDSLRRECDEAAGPKKLGGAGEAGLNAPQALRGAALRPR